MLVPLNGAFYFDMDQNLTHNNNVGFDRLKKDKICTNYIL